MALSLARKLLLTMGRRAPYLLRDDFGDTIAAGSINGTLANPGGIGTVAQRTRTVADTDGVATTSGGYYTFATPTTTGYANNHLRYGAIARVPGRMVLCEIKPATSDKSQWFGLNDSATVTNTALTNATHALFIRNDTGVMAFENNAGLYVGSYLANTTYQLAIVLRANGAFYFVRGGAYTLWTLLYWHKLDATASPIPIIANSNSALLCNTFRIPNTLWLPTPLASDGFGGLPAATDGAGHAETSGLGSGGGGLAWTEKIGSFDNVGGAAVADALTDSLASQTVTLGSADVLASVGLTRGSGAPGLCLRYVDADNYIYAYHDGTNAALIQRAGGSTSNIVAPTAATYAAGAELRASAIGLACQLFYNNARIGTGTITDAGLLSSALIGIRSTDTDSTFDNFLAYATGSGGEYGSL